MGAYLNNHIAQPKIIASSRRPRSERGIACINIGHRNIYLGTVSIEVFLRENVFTLVTDAENRFVLAVATLQILETFPA
ncbi:cystathionine beta-synthase (beta-thionase) [Moniliophthora roreri]|nr:cystathionine beta-synthase (beta-thionase) [Moniliophthora roreri]